MIEIHNGIIRWGSVRNCFGKGDFTGKKFFTGMWYRCREEFHRYGDPKPFLYKVGLISQVESLRAFLKELVKKTGRPLQVLETNQRDVLLIKPSKFWLNNIWFQLLTILVRAGRVYDGDFDATWKKCRYCRSKKVTYAIQRFFDGHQRFVGHLSRGFCAFCIIHSKEEIDAWLI